MEKKKSSLGRQKIAIAKIPKKNNLQVTFSKRRVGLFKKASELSTLCGIEIAIIVFSPANKVFSFGHPNVESIVHKFLTQHSPSDDPSSDRCVEAHRSANIRELNKQLTQVQNQLEAERKRGEEISEMRKANRREYWWEAPVDELGLEELQQLRMAMEELRKNVENQKVNKIMIQSSAINPSVYFGGVNPSYKKEPTDNDEFIVASNSMPAGFISGYGQGLPM